MEKKDDFVAELLTGRPVGEKLWSPVCGECELKKVNSCGLIEVAIETDGEKTGCGFFGNGTYFTQGECVLWPSRRCQSWSCFGAKWAYGSPQTLDMLVKREGGRNVYGLSCRDISSVYFINVMDGAIMEAEFGEYEVLKRSGTELKPWKKNDTFSARDEYKQKAIKEDLTDKLKERGIDIPVGYQALAVASYSDGFDKGCEYYRKYVLEIDD